MFVDDDITSVAVMAAALEEGEVDVRNEFPTDFEFVKERGYFMSKSTEWCYLEEWGGYFYYDHTAQDYVFPFGKVAPQPSALPAGAGGAAVPTNSNWPEFDPDYQLWRDPITSILYDVKESTQAWVVPPQLRLKTLSSPLPGLASGVFVLGPNGASIGRDRSFEPRIRLEDSFVSRYHASIYYDARQEKFGIVDRASSHGTMVNDVRISESKVASKPVFLNHGDRLQLGSTIFEIHYHPANGSNSRGRSRYRDDGHNRFDEESNGRRNRYSSDEDRRTRSRDSDRRSRRRRSTSPLQRHRRSTSPHHRHSSRSDSEDDDKSNHQETEKKPETLSDQISNIDFNSDLFKKKKKKRRKGKGRDDEPLHQPLCQECGPNTCVFVPLYKDVTADRQASHDAQGSRLSHWEELQLLKRTLTVPQQLQLQQQQQEQQQADLYRDRAAERRAIFGSEPPPHHSSIAAEDDEPEMATSLDQPIAAENKGNQLLRKLGWVPGQALGQTKTNANALIEPVRIHAHSGTAGLGAFEAAAESDPRVLLLRRQKTKRHPFQK